LAGDIPHLDEITSDRTRHDQVEKDPDHGQTGRLPEGEMYVLYLQKDTPADDGNADTHTVQQQGQNQESMTSVAQCSHQVLGRAAQGEMDENAGQRETENHPHAGGHS